METDKVARFLAQFADSKTRIADWPQWMRDAAKVSAVSFPEVRPTEKLDGVEKDKSASE
ncbi:hypothetical protein [Burkholderia sp. A9]|uniref:hypothetical protein n=1 Tax=Burkholderia sp. A9 TaxID=1365108 RepID=UPI0013793378|nr:hypothetical protein [Burkholderia sp. A9]